MLEVYFRLSKSQIIIDHKLCFPCDPIFKLLQKEEGFAM